MHEERVGDGGASSHMSLSSTSMVNDKDSSSQEQIGDDFSLLV